MTTETIQSPPNPKSSTRLFKIMMFIGIVLIGALSVYSLCHFYWTTQSIHLHLKGLKQTQTHMLQQIEALQMETKENHEKLDKKINDLEQQVQNSANPMHEMQYAWSLYKAKYAIELAALNAEWSNDTAATIALLKQADSYLSKENNAELFGVRKALANEIAAQESAAAQDTVKILSELDAIEQQVLYCPYHKPMLNNEQKLAAAQSAGYTPPITWKERMDTTLASLKQFFIVRYHEDPLQPMLTPAYQTVQKEIIRLNLQEAEWAVLQHNNALYRLALKKAYENTEHAFGQNNKKANQILQHLAQLQSENLELNKVVPTESLKLLEQVITLQTSNTTGVQS